MHQIIALYSNHMEQTYGFLSQQQIELLSNIKRELLFFLERRDYYSFARKIEMSEVLFEKEQGVSVTFSTIDFFYAEP
jgi:hypothetical protein